jgi:hypothetical protein
MPVILATQGTEAEGLKASPAKLARPYFKKKIKTKGL